MSDRPTPTWATGTTGMRHLFKGFYYDRRMSVCGNAVLRGNKPKTRAQRDPAHLYDDCKPCLAYQIKQQLLEEVRAKLSTAFARPPTKTYYDPNPPPVEPLAEPIDHSRIKVVSLHPAPAYTYPIASIGYDSSEDPKSPNYGIIGDEPEGNGPLETWIDRVNRQGRYLWSGLLAALVAKHAIEVEADRDRLLTLLQSGVKGLGNRKWLIDIRAVRRELDNRPSLEVIAADTEGRE